MGKGACVQMCFLFLYSIIVFVCHDKGNVFFCTINSPVYVYWKQVKFNMKNNEMITYFKLLPCYIKSKLFATFLY